MIWVALQARDLLKSLMTIGIVVGFTLGCCAISVPWFFPQVFTKDLAIVAEVCIGADFEDLLPIVMLVVCPILDNVEMALSSPALLTSICLVKGSWLRD